MTEHVSQDPDSVVEAGEADEYSGGPICFNFLVIFMGDDPECPGVLLDSNGSSVLTRYDAVDWKGLGETLQASIREGFPNGIKVHVANDAPDVHDMLNTHPNHPDEEVASSSAHSRAFVAMRQVALKDVRGGVIRLQSPSGLHIVEPPLAAGRPPASGVVLGVKFRDVYQAHDYFSGVMEQLTGLLLPLPTAPYSLLNTDEYAILPKPFHDWLEEQFGVIYSPRCGVLFLCHTTS